MSGPYEVVLGTDATREQWLAARTSGLGGSDAAAVLGLGGYHSPLEVYASKVGVELPDRDDEALELGRLLEEPVAQLWAQRAGLHVRRAPALLRSTRWPWLLASVDRLVYRHPRGGTPVAVYEGKARNFFAGRDWGDSVPADVVAQVWTYLAVTGLPEAHVACLVGGTELRSYTVHAEDDLLGDIAEQMGKWWSAYVEARVLPPLDGGDNGALLARLLPAIEGHAVDLDDDTVDLIRRLRAAKEQRKAAEEREHELADRLRLALGSAEIGRWHGKTAVTWKTGETSKFDIKAFRAAHPALAAEFTCKTPTRTLLPKDV